MRLHKNRHLKRGGVAGTRERAPGADSRRLVAVPGGEVGTVGRLAGRGCRGVAAVRAGCWQFMPCVCRGAGFGVLCGALRGCCGPVKRVSEPVIYCLPKHQGFWGVYLFVYLFIFHISKMLVW